MNKINDIQLSNIENKQERLWFSIIKQLSKETGFGNLEISLTIKDGKITNVLRVQIKENFNINS